MNPIDRLVEMFEHFPGIGPRQARRFVQYLLVQKQSMRADIAEQIRNLGNQTQQCKECFRWFVREGVRADVCSICANPSRDHSLLFVVEKDADLDQVERSGFKGLYLALGGAVPLAAEEPEKFIRMRELLKRVEHDGAAEKLKEIILGLSATTEGDHTRFIIQEKLLPLAEKYQIKLSSLGRGLSTGSELEYADPDTIASALHSRQ